MTSNLVLTVCSHCGAREAFEDVVRMQGRSLHPADDVDVPCLICASCGEMEVLRNDDRF